MGIFGAHLDANAFAEAQISIRYTLGLEPGVGGGGPGASACSPNEMCPSASILPQAMLAKRSVESLHGLRHPVRYLF
jgi:hypothetical protein